MIAYTKVRLQQLSGLLQEERNMYGENGQMKKHTTAAKDPNSPPRLSRKKWRCSGDKSRKA